ncbi:MAG: SusC/RagA family TonB-linked outer membrane protein [Gemmatimonadetes bacterium]|nr:MAG: SusC/RagA family TonB-linked outer membrane protein [Gemmatimonadota bacterium]
MKRFMSALLSLTLAAALFASADVSAQEGQRRISGTVVGELGQPLPLVIVRAVGTSFQTQTNNEGRFIITAPSGEVELRFENFGYRTQTVTVPASQSSVSVTMELDVLNIEGIVVTGQATTVARRNLANAVASVTTEQIEKAPPAASIENFMQGKIAGAYIEQNSGAPGGGIQVRLRGVSTINGELEPLYVIDGVVASNVSIANGLNVVSVSAGGSNASSQDDPVNRIADINPNDIERIEILKGASASALYGSRAANGVVLITTKRGRSGQRQIRFTQRFGTFDLNNKFGFRKWTRDEAIDAGLVDATTAGQYFRADGQPINNFDLEELLAGRNALSWESDASISGGDADTRYFLSATWKDDAGIIDHTGFERQGIRLNLNQNFGDRFRLNTSTNLLRSKAERGLTNNDNSGTSYYMVFPFTPSFVDLRKQPDGTFPANPFERSNPLQTVELFQNDEIVWRLLTSVSAEYDLYQGERHGLQVLGTAGVDFFTQKNILFAPPELQFEPNDGLAGTSALSNSTNRDITLTGNLVYTYNTDDFASTATFGVQYEDRDQDIARTVARGLTAGQPNVNAGVQTSVNQFRSIVRDLGFFLQEELLLLDERLLVSAGIRADRSSVNADPNNFFWYPKAAASYRFDNLTDWLDGLKLRVAWGESGNQPMYGQKFTPLIATSNINSIAGVVVAGITGDPGLKPERQREIEGGVDLTLFDGNAQVEITAFQKNITDLILQRTVAPSTGFGTQVFNGGEARVRGLEIGVFATPIQRGDFSWVSRTTYFRDYSKVLDLPVPAFETGGFGTGLGAFRIEEGASLTQIVSTVGQDANGDPIVKNVGDATPDFRIGFSNTFTWGNWELGSVLDWSHGATVINLTRLLADAGQNSADFNANVRTRTLSDADKTQVELGDGNFRFTNWVQGNDTRGYIEDGSYLKIRELSLSYNLPQAWVRGVLGQAVESGRISVSGRNLFTFTDYTGVDPEVSNFGNQPIARNIDVAPFPPSRSIWFAVDLVF